MSLDEKANAADGLLESLFEGSAFPPPPAAVLNAAVPLLDFIKRNVESVTTRKMQQASCQPTSSNGSNLAFGTPNPNIAPGPFIPQMPNVQSNITPHNDFPAFSPPPFSQAKNTSLQNQYMTNNSTRSTAFFSKSNYPSGKDMDIYSSNDSYAANNWKESSQQVASHSTKNIFETKNNPKKNWCLNL